MAVAARFIVAAERSGLRARSAAAELARLAEGSGSPSSTVTRTRPLPFGRPRGQSQGIRCAGGGMWIVSAASSTGVEGCGGDASSRRRKVRCSDSGGGCRKNLEVDVDRLSGQLQHF